MAGNDSLFKKKINESANKADFRIKVREAASNANERIKAAEEAERQRKEAAVKYEQNQQKNLEPTPLGKRSGDEIKYTTTGAPLGMPAVAKQIEDVNKLAERVNKGILDGSATIADVNNYKAAVADANETIKRFRDQEKRFIEEKQKKQEKYDAFKEAVSVTPDDAVIDARSYFKFMSEGKRDISYTNNVVIMLRQADEDIKNNKITPISSVSDYQNRLSSLNDKEKELFGKYLNDTLTDDEKAEFNRDKYVFEKLAKDWVESDSFVSSLLSDAGVSKDEYMSLSFTNGNVYKKEADNISKEMSELVPKWLNGNITQDELNTFGKKYAEFQAKELNYIYSGQAAYEKDIISKEEYEKYKNLWEYEKVALKADFEENSKFEKKEVKYTPNILTDYSYNISDYDAHRYNLINGEKSAKSVDYQNDLQNYSVFFLDTDDDIRYEYLKFTELEVYNYLYKTKGKEAAQEYLDALDENGDILRLRRIVAEQEENRKFATEDPFAASLFSVGKNITNIFPSSIAAIEGLLSNEDINVNSPLYTGHREVNTIRSTVEGNIDNDFGKFFYRHGMNLADQVANSTLGGWSKAITNGLFMTGAFNDNIYDAKERGLSDEQAFAFGATGAAAEGFFESKAFDRLFDGKTFREDGWKYIAKNVATEIVGENATNAVNDISDYLIAQDLSKLKLTFDKYVSEGMTEKEAWEQVTKDKLYEAFDTTLGAGLNSFALSGTGATAKFISEWNTGRSFNKDRAEGKLTFEDINVIIETGLESDKNSAAYKYAEKMKSNYEAGKEITNYQLGHLFNLNKAEIEKEAFNATVSGYIDGILNNADENSKSYIFASELKSSISNGKSVSEKELKTLETLYNEEVKGKVSDFSNHSVEAVPEEGAEEPAYEIAEPSPPSSEIEKVSEEAANETVSKLMGDAAEQQVNSDKDSNDNNENTDSGTPSVSTTETVEARIKNILSDIEKGGSGNVMSGFEAKQNDARSRVKNVINGNGNSADVSAIANDYDGRQAFYHVTGKRLSNEPDVAISQIEEYVRAKNSAASPAPAVEADTSDVSVNEGIDADEELVDYGVNDRQAALERAVDGDGEIARLTERYENGEMSEAEYNEAVTRRVSEIERSISEGDGYVSEADSAPVADGVTENGGTKVMSKDEFDTVRNNSYSVTRNSAKDIKANPIFAKVSASDIRAFRAVGKALGVDVKAFDGETLGLTGTDGAYDNKTRTIYLNVTSPLKAISSAFRHEVIHYLKASSHKAYGEFAAFVIDKYKEQYSDEDYNAWLEAKRKEYEAMGETLTRDGAEEEFLAQFGMDMLQQKSTARDFVRHHRSVAMKVWDAIRNLINKIRRFYGMQELPTSVYDAISQLAENTSGQIQVYGDSYTRSHLRGSEELLPGELNIDALNAVDEALLNAFVEVADINKRVQAKLKNAPKDVLNDDVKRAQYIEELWAEETGVESNGDADVKLSTEVTGFTKDAYNNNCYELVKMNSVSNLSGHELDGDLPLSTKLKNLFSSWNNVVPTNKYGEVAVNTASIRSDIRHGSTYEKVAAYAAIPDVLRNGVTIDVYKKNHGEIERIITAAPIKIGEKTYYMGVMIQRDSNTNRLYLHDVVIKKEASEYQANHLNTTGSIDTENLFMTEVLEKALSIGYSIAENELSVNTSDEKKSLAKVDNGDSADRLEKLNSDSGVKFSKAKVDNGEDSGYNKSTLDSVSYEKRYNELSSEERSYYDRAKKGDSSSAFKLINALVGTNNKGVYFAKVSKDTFLLPIIGVEGTSDNVLPSYIAEYFGDEYGLRTFDGIYKSNESNSRSQGVWNRMKENYPSFEIGKNINASVIKGKKFILIDDNSTTGRTFNGLKSYIEENGGTVEGYYALTVGQDASEKMTVNENTWKKATDIGIEKLKQFAKEEGVKREISRQGLTERECQELVNRWEKRRLSDTGRRTEDDRASSGKTQGVQGVSARDGETGAVQETSTVKYSKSSPDSSDTAYIPKGEKPARDIDDVKRLNKKLEKKTQKLEKTNADITARLADAEKRLKITNPYSPDSKQIDALAERIADTFIGEYRGKNTVSNIAKSLTEIFRTWNEGNVKGNINKLAEADRMISNLASTLISGTSEYYGENEVVKALAGELTEEITSITPVKNTAAVNALARTEESLARTERKLNESDSKLSAAIDVIKLTESNLKKAEAQLESTEKKLTVSTLRKESLQKKVDFLSHTRPIYIQKEIAQKRFDNANALADAAELDGLKSIALMYRNDAKFWQKQLDNVKKAEEYLDRKAMDRRRLREHISQKLGVPLATPDRSLPFVEQLKLVWNKHKNDSKELAVAKAVYKLNKEESKVLLDFLKGEISYEEVVELGNKKTKDGEARYNVDKILKLAKAMVNFANDEAVIADYNNETKRQRDKTTDEFLDRVDEAGGINDKGLAFNVRATRETPERVIRMIVKDESLANEMINYYVKPIHTNEASANRFKNKVIKKVKDLKLETNIKKGNIVSESYAVQFVGEVEDNIRYLEKNAKSADTMRDGKTLLEWRETLDEFKKSNPNLDFDRIHKAIDVFRGIYDDLFSRVNEARMLNGYPPMPYRSGYFPHFTDEGSDGLLSKAARSMGLSGTVSELPSNISGLTYMFKPGIKWMANAMERTGYLTAFDALEGLDRYLASASDVIFHTGDIQRLRSLERRIRYRATDTGIKDRVDLIRGKRNWSTKKKKNRIDKILNDAGDDITLEIQDKIRKIEGDTSLTIEEQDKRIAEIFEKTRFDGSNFVVWLGEYTNNLAGKQALTDRIMEQRFGRAAFNVVSRLEGRIAKNMIIGNMSSYMSNFIPLTQAMAVLDSPASLTRGMIGTIRSTFKQDAVSTDSDFYRNRLGSDVLSMTFGENFADKLLTPMEIIDKFVAGSIVRARYYDNLKKGMSESDAMDEADTMAANIMADRSKGSVPVIFNDKNPISKMFTMFQVEVNNQVSFWTKDISAEAKKRGVANMALRLMLASIFAWLFNDLYEELTGRKPALSPIDIINDAVGKGLGVKLNGPTEIVKELFDGDDEYWNPEKVEDYGIWQGVSELGEGVAEQLPFTSALNIFGLELDSGRIPVSGAYPDLAKLFKTVSDGKTSSEKKWDVAKDELVKPFYYAVLPMGGGQIKKINEGIGAIKRGGSYSNADKKGRRELQYPVFTDEGVWNIVKTVLFGKSSNEGAVEWVESGFKNALGDTATEVYINLKDSEAVSQRDVYNFLVELSGINKDTVLDGIIVPKDASDDVKKRAFLRQSGLPDEVKAIIYAGYIADKKNDEPELDILAEAGENVGEVYRVISDIKDCSNDAQRRTVLLNSSLPEDEKYSLYKAMMYNNGEGSKKEDWEKETDNYYEFFVAGLDFDDYLKARIEKYGIEQKGLKPAAEANEFYSWARDNYGDEKAKVIYSTLPSSSGFVLGLDDISGVKYADAGVSNDNTARVIEALGELEPLPGKKQVSDLQKVEAVISLNLSDDELMGAVGVIYDGSQMEKLDAAVKNGVNVKDYVKLQATALEIDAEGKFGSANGSVDTKELKAAIDKMQSLSVKEKAVLYQTYSKTSNPASNPYDVEVGYKISIENGWDMDNSKEIRGIISNNNMDDTKKLKELQPLMENEMFEITEGASKNGIPVKTAFDVIQKFDKDYSIYGYKSDDERDALKQTAKSKTGLGISQYYGKLAVDSVSGLSTAQKAILWQSCDPSWSHKNNPYSPNIGAKYRSEMGWNK